MPTRFDAVYNLKVILNRLSRNEFQKKNQRGELEKSLIMQVNDAIIALFLIYFV